jgi:hypothetical protein
MSPHLPPIHNSSQRAALPMSALRRPHDRDRGIRTRLQAEVAADTDHN